MSIYIKSAAAVAVLVVVLQVCIALQYEVPLAGSTGNGGLGAVSAGFGEALVEFVVLTSVIWAVLYVGQKWDSSEEFVGQLRFG